MDTLSYMVLKVGTCLYIIKVTQFWIELLTGQ